MSEILGQAANAVIWALIAGIPLLFLLLMLPFTRERTKRSLGYLLTFYKEWRQVKADPNATVDIPNYETIKEPIKAVKDQRVSKEKKP